MSSDPRKRQKKQERRTARRKAKHHQMARQKAVGLGEQLVAATHYPVLYSWITEDLWTQGMGQACISRELPDGTIAFAVFLIDRFCLGVKNAWGEIGPRFSYESRIERHIRSKFQVRDVSPATVRKLVEEAEKYAAELGFPPHPDYQKAKLIFGDIDPNQSSETFEFGQEGKPLFIAGPNDTPTRCKAIINKLTQKLGQGGFHFMVPMSAGLFEPVGGNLPLEVDYPEDEDEEDEP